MKIFLLVVLGVVAGLFVFLALGWLWLKRKLKGLGESLAALAHSAPPVFRITLDPCVRANWDNPAVVDRATTELESLGYRQAGDFTVPEMADLPLRGFWHPGEQLYGVVYDHPEVGVFGDLTCELDDDTHWTVSCAPETGQDRPEKAPLFRIETAMDDPDGVREMHSRLLLEVEGRNRVLTSAEGFPGMFVQAYHDEMDWRIARGGPTPDEIRGAAAAGGMDEPDERQIELVQAMWSGAIQGFVEEQIQEVFLAETSLSAAEWEAKRDRVVIVHDLTDAEERIDDLAWLMTDYQCEEDSEVIERAYEDAKARLDGVFDGKSVREAFAAAQALLPDDKRCEAIGSVAKPWTADVYLLPELPDDT